MQVNKTTGESPRIDGPAKPQASSATPVTPADATTPVRRVDEVEISTAGQILSGDQAVDPSVEAELGASRVADIRSKISAGDYLTLEVAHETARNIVHSGDL